MKILWCVVVFLITLLLASHYHKYEVYERIIHLVMFMIFHFILVYAFVNLTNTILPTFKTFIKDLCGRLVVLLDYVKDLVDDTPSTNLPNINPNLMPNSPSHVPSSSHTFEEVQAMVEDTDVQDFFALPSPLIHDDIKGKGKETSSKPIIPYYKIFSHEHDKQSPPVEYLHDMYTT